MATKADREWDVVIVGSGFAGALIAHALGKAKKSVIVLEAGAGVPVNVNEYMNRFFMASAKVPESPYTPEVFGPNGLNDPNEMNAGRPTVLSLGPAGGFGDWKDPKQSYLIQTGESPFASTYERVAGGTSHWLGTSLRFVPNDFKMKTLYGQSVPQFVDWPIGYDELESFYRAAEAELGVSADVGDQKYLGVEFPNGYQYPMPRIPTSTVDQQVDKSLNGTPLTEDETRFLGMAEPVRKIAVRSLPAARNSQPYRNRRACAGNTNCIPICPIQAKYDPTITLNDAMDTGFVKMRSHAVASEIVVGENGRISQINYIRYKTDLGEESETGFVKGKVYVIAANAIETVRLLQMSRNRQGIANTSDQVGRNLMDHPYYVAWGLSRTPLFPYRGPLITSGIGDLCDGPFRSERGAFRVDIGNEGWNFVIASTAGAGDPNVTALDFVNGMNRTGLNPGGQGVLGKEALFGKALVDKLSDRYTRQFRIGFLIEQTPDSVNRVTLSDKFTDGLGLPRPQVAYSLSEYTKKGFDASYRMKNLLFMKMGITEFTAVGDNDPSRFEREIDGKKVIFNYAGAGHIMGTYRMGDNPNTSVVDSFQRSHDHKNLYLVGSGTFPTGATANPTLTIAALSLRTAKNIIDEFK
ncbi:GMC family oxidoreductase [Bradyrhizobium sp. S3.2.12]|uniref:GMC family oxidoreductase n=1 Tax=Bradyrhizobium sp. S3.2.12 TaxID=3156387 RepID=UPI00339B832E